MVNVELPRDRVHGLGVRENQAVTLVIDQVQVFVPEVAAPDFEI